MKILSIIPTLALIAICNFCLSQNPTTQPFFTITYTPSNEIINEYDTLFNLNVTIHDISSIPACAGVKIQVIKINDNSVFKEISKNLVALSNSNQEVLIEKIFPSEYRIEVKATNTNGNIISSLNQH